jgi:hypothetical protein
MLNNDQKIDETDEGALRFGIGIDQGRVILQFDSAVRWLGMEPHQARAMAESLTEMAAKAEETDGGS